MNSKTIVTIATTLAIGFSSCTNSDKKAEEKNYPDPLIANIDSTVSPGVDFFHYANGAWFKAHPIPSSESYNGLWLMIGDTINAQVKSVCVESANANAAKGTNKQKIGDFYASGMDTVAIEKAGITPLNDEFARIAAVKDVPSLMTEIAHLQSIGVGSTFGFGVGQDDKISTKYALFFFQGGLGLGNREYYFAKDAATTQIRRDYVTHISNMFKLMVRNEVEAAKNASLIMNLETDLAGASRKMEDLRDPKKNYNKMPITQFNKIAPNGSWNNMMETLAIKNADTVVVGQPEFFTALNSTLKKYSIEDWKVYLQWNLISDYAEFLNKAFDNESFHFYSTILEDVKEQKERWKRVVERTNSALGELIGQVYVDEYLPKGCKEKLLEIGNNIRDVYADHIKNLPWISDSTKVKALSKLSGIVMKVGYPDKWKDMSALEIDRSSYCMNVMRSRQWKRNYNYSKFGTPVDRTEWTMYPQTYNAYYNSSNNEIVVPACNIIVPGFEGRMPDDAILYGIIGGSTFGHEITHGFDDQGSKYDANGNLNEWWSDEDRRKFESKTGLIVKQFGSYKIDSLYINGSNTQGENIADLGGVAMGFEAFKKTDQFKNNVVIGGLNPDQRYFISYAYSWMINNTPKSIARQIMTDEHSPAQYRVNGPLANNPDFYKAFNIKEGDPMWRADSVRVVIW